MKFCDELKGEVLEVNRELGSSGLVYLTWGNASGYDEASGLVAIKPSGVAYGELTLESLVVVDLEGNVVAGDLRPSMDAETHLEIYRNFDGVRGVVHTHSVHGTVFAQAGMGIPCLGTTHADHFGGEVPCVPTLGEAEVLRDYELNTGRSIVAHFRERGIDPGRVPGAVVEHHGPFTWGTSPRGALENGVALEMCAKMAILTRGLDAQVEEIPRYVIRKHQERKHGPDAYYGQAE